MLIELKRDSCGPICTLGKLYIDGVLQCFTLEDIERPNGEKVYGETCIPTGRYRVDVTWSNHFRCDLPLICDVPNFTGIRIHPGNTVADTFGCVLLGTYISKEGHTILESRKAFDKVFPQIRDAVNAHQQVWIEIKNI